MEYCNLAQLGAMPEQEDIASHFRYLLTCDFVKVTDTSFKKMPRQDYR